MSDTYRDYINAVLAIFEKNFTQAYRQSSAQRRARLLPYVTAIYRRWQYAALVEDTLLTPANLTESINRAFDQPPGLSPVLRLRSDQRYSGFETELFEYSMEQHPAVSDLKRLIAYCQPDLELDEEDNFSEAQASELAGELSLRDPLYASYLLGAAFRMGLITKIPSIYANRAQVAKDADERLTAPNEAILCEIVEATIQLSAFSLNDLIALPEPVFGESFIRSILKKPMETDDIFQRVYDMMGITLEDMFEQDFENDIDDMDGMDAAFLSSTFMLGVFIDRFFFTPLGHYLKLIRPIYVLPFDFENEIKYFLESSMEPDELFVSFFAPCSKYYLTELGLQYFKVAPSPRVFVDVKTQLPFDLLKKQFFHKKSVLDAMPAHARRAEDDAPPGGMVYTLKIKSDPAYWINLEMPAEATLHRLYLEAASFFGLNCNMDYSFFHDETENPFAEYVSPKKARRAKKTADIPLESLDFEHKRKLLLTCRNQNSGGSKSSSVARLSLELMQVKPREAGRSYPALARMSKALKALSNAP